MNENVDFSTINAIPYSDVQIVNGFFTTENRDTGEPTTMVLKIALNRTTACSESCEFPVFIPASTNFKQPQHVKMLELFRSGAPWVPVTCIDLRVYRKKHNQYYLYYGNATSFTVVDYSTITEDK